jgi:phosphate starvation-inducible PhoH-like protein
MNITSGAKVPKPKLKKTVSLVPLNASQEAYLEALRGPSSIVVVTGPAGTGKTYMATVEAANLYVERKIDKIILTRPNVAAGKDLGHLPGTLEEKFAPWLTPILETLTEGLTKGVVEAAVKAGEVEYAPLTYMRGRSLQNAFVIVDEAQNLTIPEMVLLTTRIGDNTKMIINGDVLQKDIKEKSGLKMLIEVSKKYEIDLDLIEFGFDDIVRSKLCKQFVKAYMQEGLL